MTRNNLRAGERGNIFFMIMIGIVLFGALAYTFSRGVRQGTGDMSDRQLEIVVSDMLTYAQKVERGVDRVIRRSISEAALSFDHETVTNSNIACAAGATCQVFHPSGGAVQWQNPPPNVNDGTDWMINGRNFIQGIGCSTSLDPTCPDLTLFLPNVTRAACMKINERLGVTNPSGEPPVDTDTDVEDGVLFNGSFGEDGELISTGGPLDGRNAGCFRNAPAAYTFYYVLLAR